MTVLGIGLDLIDLKRFEMLYGGNDPEIMARCFTPKELAAAEEGIDRIERLAARFAAKEAILKVIGGLVDGLALTDIEIARASDGQPSVTLHGLALDRAKARGVHEIHVSLTHSAASAAAVAIAVSAPTSR